MEKWLAVFLAMLLALGLAAAAAETDAEGAFFLTTEELEHRVITHLGLNLLDVRTEEDYAAGHIPEAMSFPLDTLKEELQRILDGGFSYMDAEMVVYGESGEQGERASQILRELGFSNVFVLNAVSDWPGRMYSAEEERRILGTLYTTDLAGEMADVSLLRGHRLTMVNIWATYCGPCIHEMPELARLAKEMEPEGVQIVGLVSDVMQGEELRANEASLAQAWKIIEDTGADYPHLLPSAALMRSVIYQTSAVPTTFFVDETGAQVGTAYVGSRNYEAWKEIILVVLAQLP